MREMRVTTLLHASLLFGHAPGSLCFASLVLQDYWEDEDNMLNCHMHWHMALFQLEEADTDFAFARYDVDLRAVCSSLSYTPLGPSECVPRAHLAFPLSGSVTRPS